MSKADSKCAVRRGVAAWVALESYQRGPRFERNCYNESRAVEFYQDVLKGHRSSCSEPADACKDGAP